MSISGNVGNKRLRILVMAVVAISMIAPAAGAQAEGGSTCGDDIVQEGWFVDGGWQLAQAPLAELVPVEGGLAWTALEGAVIRLVNIETGPVEVEDATISAAKAVPGAPTGTIEFFSEGTLRVSVLGSIPCPQLPALQVHEDPVEAFEPPAPPPPPAAVPQQEGTERYQRPSAGAVNVPI